MSQIVSSGNGSVMRPQWIASLISSLTFICSLLSGGPACAVSLPDTGQTLCYDGVDPFGVIACSGTGQDGAYPSNQMNFTLSSGMITDNNTGLVWQQQDDGNAYNWYQAAGVYHATYNADSSSVCAAQNLGGHSDWRLPHMKELMSIIDYAVAYPGPAADPIFGAAQANYWSASSYLVGPPGNAWILDFGSGTVNAYLKSFAAHVRCVRGGLLAVGAYADNYDHTAVTDNGIGLMWQKVGLTGQTTTWNQALAYCEDLALGGYSDWRLPNIKELATVIDESGSSNRLVNIFFFPGMSPYHLWSSTTYASATQSARVVYIADGSVGASNKGNHNDVWCVRGGETGGLPASLSIAPAGTGSGLVVSSPAGIMCGSTCTAPYPLSSIISLTAVPAAGGSIFSGWSGHPDCGDGVVTLSSGLSCTATFDLCAGKPVLIASPPGYDTIGDAYVHLGPGENTIRVVASNQQESLEFRDSGKNITLGGGYDCFFTEPPGLYTMLTGSLAVYEGSVAVNRLMIQ